MGPGGTGNGPGGKGNACRTHSGPAGPISGPAGPIPGPARFGFGPGPGPGTGGSKSLRPLPAGPTQDCYPALRGTRMRHGNRAGPRLEAPKRPKPSFFFWIFWVLAPLGCPEASWGLGQRAGKVSGRAVASWTLPSPILCFSGHFPASPEPRSSLWSPDWPKPPLDRPWTGPRPGSGLIPASPGLVPAIFGRFAYSGQREITRC